MFRSGSASGKLKSVQYLVEQCNVDANAMKERIYDKNDKLLRRKKDTFCESKPNTEYLYAPIHLASENGHLDIVRYLYEQCHVDAGVKDRSDETPIQK